MKGPLVFSISGGRSSKLCDPPSQSASSSTTIERGRELQESNRIVHERDQKGINTLTVLAKSRCFMAFVPLFLSLFHMY
ncbi:Protein phosphatase [Psidium guajava]|nr:Protein phosphatase [Psidium guajava]